MGARIVERTVDPVLVAPADDGDDLSDTAANTAPVQADQYEILETMASGSGRALHKVRHRDTGAIYALKIFERAKAADPLVLKLAKQRITQLSALMHPNIGSVYDVGTTSGGATYCLTEFVDGRTLAEELSEDGCLDLERFYFIFLQVCEALVYAHQHKVFHGNITPSNIMICKGKDGIEQVKLLDFAIDHLPDDADKPKQPIPESGHALAPAGWPYASPEMQRGERLAAHMDIYSLGAVMHHALLGCPPGVKQNAGTQTARKAKRICELRHDCYIAPILDMLVSTYCLAADPALRVDSVEHVYDQLRILSTPLAKHSPRLSLGIVLRYLRIDLRRLSKCSARHLPATLGCGVAVAAWLAITPVAYHLLFEQNDYQRHIDRAQAALINRNYKEVASEWTTAIDQATRAGVPGWKLSELNEAAGDDLQSYVTRQLRVRSVDGPEQVDTLIPAGNKDTYRQAQYFYDRALLQVERSRPRQPAREQRLLSKLAGISSWLHSPEQRLRYLKLKLQANFGAGTLDSNARISLFDSLGHAYEDCGDLAKAAAMFTAAQSLCRGDWGYRHDLARVYELQGDLPKAEHFLKASLSAYERLSAQDNDCTPQMIETYCNLSRVAEKQGNLKEQQEFLAMADKLKKTTIAPGDSFSISGGYATSTDP